MKAGKSDVVKGEEIGVMSSGTLETQPATTQKEQRGE